VQVTTLKKLELLYFKKEKTYLPSETEERKGKRGREIREVNGENMQSSLRLSLSLFNHVDRSIKFQRISTSLHP
jgi:hypothetical protein